MMPRRCLGGCRPVRVRARIWAWAWLGLRPSGWTGCHAQRLGAKKPPPRVKSRRISGSSAHRLAGLENPLELDAMAHGVDHRVLEQVLDAVEVAPAGTVGLG